MRKIAAAGAGCLLVMGAGAGVASGETQEEAEARALAQCGEGFLCVWDNFNYTGTMVQFYECPAEALLLDGLPDGRLGSFMNTQFQGTVAEFYGPGVPVPGEPQYTSTAPENSPDDKGFETLAVDPC